MTTEKYDEQENFWKGDFGDIYTDRNDQAITESNLAFFRRIFNNINVDSVFEIGCNRGLNFTALNSIDNMLSLNGLEINEKAFNMCQELGLCTDLYNESIFEFSSDKQYDLVFTKGVMIHINPERLDKFISKMYAISTKYILICEYYSRNLQEINYRGHTSRLWKRDFCGLFLDKYSDLELKDYGFTYYRDPNHPQDDITWFLLEKCS